MNALVYRSILAILIAFLVCFYLVPLLISFAGKLNFIDEPDGKIKNHKNPTPYLGGVAVYVGFLSAICLALPFENNMLLFFIGSTLLLFVGLIDDLVVLNWYQKFFGQILAVLCFLKAGFYLKAEFFSNYWNVLFSVLWMLLIINAFNLVDVMDGLATTLAFCVTGSFLGIAWYFHLSSVVLLLSAFLGALIGFFLYNKPVARIYLGDAGSLFIGGFLATIPFFINWGIYNRMGYLSPIIILGIPLLEVTTLIIVRTYKNIPFYKGSPDHFSIYLLNNGWAKEAILLYVFILSSFLGLSAFSFLLNQISFAQLLILGVSFLALWIGVVFFEKPAFLGGKCPKKD